MGRLRVGMIVTAIAGVGVVALSLVDCAPPTQIVIEVRSDACGGKPNALFRTGIAVGRASEIEKRDFSAFREGCEDKATGGVGTLTIFPSGNNDDEVAIKVVGGVEVQPTLCPAPGYPGCIAHRRIMRFVPNQSQRVIVNLSLACLNRTCPEGTTCDNGVCKSVTDILPDGRTRDDAATTDAGTLDADVDACTGCVGACANGECKVNCMNGGCTGELCAKTLPCTIECPATGNCDNISCTTNQKCTVNCGDKPRSCNKVVCSAYDCYVHCNGAQSCAADAGGGIFLDASHFGRLECTESEACNVAGCIAQDCDLTCEPSGGKRSCPDASTCAGGNCVEWITPKQP